MEHFQENTQPLYLWERVDINMLSVGSSWVRVLALLFLLSSFANAQTPVYNLDLAVGQSQLTYQEHEANLDSIAKPSFLNINGNAMISYLNRYLGCRVSIPISNMTATETWKLSNVLYQTNDLAYSLANLDLYYGHSFSEIVNIIGGTRLMRGEQNRENFYQNGVKQDAPKSIETINSISAFIEFFGESDTQLLFGYKGFVVYPLYVSTTNSSYPGISFSSSGLSYGAGISLGYLLDSGTKITAAVNYDNIRYDGTQWLEYGGQSIKWPLNVTDNITYSLGVLTII